ncbi:MAG TPA: hypothetical protein VH814_21060 [Steroidobacteraceae bacterium]|jgi:hypothetical protein
MRPNLSLVLLATALMTGCGGGAATAVQPQTAAAASNAEAAPAAAAAKDSAKESAARELVNPDASTMVFLYYELAHLPLPIDTWVEEDSRVRFAPPPDKAARRAAVRAELESAAASVRGVGALRLTMNANLSDYDPSYGEFTVRALSPSSVVNFDALGQKVAVSFTNGRTAQIWRVPQAEAQGIRDKIGYAGNIEMDALLRIANVLPGPGGGTLATEVIEYELRETQRGVAIARVQLANR